VDGPEPDKQAAVEAPPGDSSPQAAPPPQAPVDTAPAASETPQVQAETPQVQAETPPAPAETAHASTETPPAPAETAHASAETPQTASIEANQPRSRHAPVRPSRVARISKRVRIALAFVAGGAIAAAVGLPLTGGSSSPDSSRVAAAASLAGLAAGSASNAVEDAGVEAAAADASEPAAEARPAVWRVARLADDPGITLVEGAIARRPLLTALASAGLPHAEATRIVHSLDDVRDVERFGPKDTFTVARDKASGHVVAYEIVSSPTDVWQGHEETLSDGTLKLVPRKLDLPSERVRVRRALVVGPDLRASLTEAGLAPIEDVLSMLDDALEGHAELSDIRAGSRLRLVATQERVDGVFARWTSLEAVEYFPSGANAPPVRVYNAGDDDEHAGKRGDRHDWYDAKGRQPYHGGWRAPVPLARIASRFNPHRMHPILHVVMPHNGVDFVASTGTPVYATAAGTVIAAGNGGACGNMVEIDHPGGITSVYCHLSRFAAGLHPGQHVESRQLVAYSGQTGRATGPHLHFGIKKNGVFVDPMTLRLDGVRVLPRSKREQFERLRAALDGELDAIPLPAQGAPAPAESEPQDTFYEEP
jgi:murein DD-endopeptidase MepM/ murein hydrolase activator NlpD